MLFLDDGVGHVPVVRLDVETAVERLVIVLPVTVRCWRCVAEPRVGALNAMAESKLGMLPALSILPFVKLKLVTPVLLIPLSVVV